ncbi:MAG: fliF, partial [Acidimicrobiia bacterium]|nr:fliF [Acidimicrobiia bacterium]
FALLDKEGITTSTFKQRTDYQRALAGEIGRTVEAMDNVEKAKVNLVIPTDDVFSADTRKASASVFLKTKGTAQMSREQAKSVAHLVASSVPELSVDNVTITDATGRSLWMGGTTDTGPLTSEQAQQTVAFEQRKAQAINDMLASVLGPNNVKATVAADLDFTQKERNQVQYSNSNPGQDPLINSTERASTVYNTPTAGQVGVLGADGQPLVPNGVVGANGAQKYEERTDKTNYDVNQVNSVEKDAPGAVNRLTIAVAVNSNASTFNASDTEKLNDLVRQAAGYSAARGDVFSGINAVAFDSSAANAAKKELTTAPTTSSSNGLMQGALLLAAILGVLAMALWALRRHRNPAVEVIDLRELEMMRAAELEAGLEAPHELSAAERMMELTVSEDAEFEGSPLALPAGEEGEDQFADPWNSGYAPPPAAALVESMEAEINSLVDSQSEDVAILLRNWMGDRRAVTR